MISTKREVDSCFIRCQVITLLNCLKTRRGIIAYRDKWSNALSLALLIEHEAREKQAKETNEMYHRQED